jgi:hypothetical protein
VWTVVTPREGKDPIHVFEVKERGQRQRKETFNILCFGLMYYCFFQCSHLWDWTLGHQLAFKQVIWFMSRMRGNHSVLGKDISIISCCILSYSPTAFLISIDTVLLIAVWKEYNGTRKISSTRYKMKEVFTGSALLLLCCSSAMFYLQPFVSLMDACCIFWIALKILKTLAELYLYAYKNPLNDKPLFLFQR